MNIDIKARLESIRSTLADGNQAAVSVDGNVRRLVDNDFVVVYYNCVGCS